MALNINKVILGGRLTKDIDLGKTQSGKSIVSFTIAVDRKSGEGKATDFINCVAWDKRAELIAEYFHKGSQICVVGSLRRKEWTNANGEKRYDYDVFVEELHFIDSIKKRMEEEEMTPVYEEDLPF